MTVSNQTNKARHLGDNSTVAFVLTATVRDRTHLEVTTRDETTLVETKLVLDASGDTGYTAAVATDFSSVTVTTNVAPISGTSITINRVVPITQEDDYALFDGFPATVIEGTADLGTMVDQLLREILSRVFQLPNSTTLSDPEIEDLVGNSGSYLRVNSDEDGVEWISVDLADAVQGAVNSLAGTIYESVQDIVLADSPKSLGIGDEGALMRVDTTGNTPTSITGVTLGTTTKLIVASHTFSVGEFVYVDSIVGTTQLNGRTYKISSLNGGTTDITITDTNDVNIDSSGYTAWSSAGTITESLTINLPDLSLLAEDYKIAIMKSSADANSIVVNGVNTQRINGSTHVLQDLRYQTVVYVGDFDNLQWFSIGTGTGLASIHRETFDGNTATITLANDPASENNTQIYINGVYQHKATYSLSNSVITFSTAPPAGTGNVEVISIATENIGVPADNSINIDKIEDGVLDQTFVMAASDETTDLEAGTGKVEFQMPYAWEVKGVTATLTTVATGAALLTVDINVDGTSILSTKLTIDASEKTSVTANTPYVFASTNPDEYVDVAANSVITIDLDAIGNITPGAGLKVTLIGKKS